MTAVADRSTGDTVPGVRALDPADIGSLVDLWVESWRATFPGIDFEARREWIRLTLRDDAGATIVAYDATGLTGFAIYVAPTLHQLVVANRKKGHGTARQLLEAVKARASDHVLLDVNQGNARAVAFYEREGFVRVGEGVNAFNRRIWHMRGP